MLDSAAETPQAKINAVRQAVALHADRSNLFIVRHEIRQRNQEGHLKQRLEASSLFAPCAERFMTFRSSTSVRHKFKLGEIFFEVDIPLDSVRAEIFPSPCRFGPLYPLT